MANITQFDTKRMFLESHTKKIKDTILKMHDDFMYIAFLLWEVKEYSYYEESYKDIYEYSQMEIPMSKTQTKDYIRLCEEYSERTKSGCPSMKLAQKYREYNVSQLIEMLGLPALQRPDVRPEMTIKQIKELKKELKMKNSLTSNIDEQMKLVIPEKDNELRCDNCGEYYPVNKELKKQWITIGDRKVFSCCYRVHWDVELLKNEKEV